MTDNIYEKRVPTRLFYRFRVKRVVFMAVTNCFRENFTDFLSFAFLCCPFCSPMTKCPY